MRFEGRLFGPGLPAAGVVATAALDAAQLAVDLPGGARQRAPLTQLQLRAAGFDERQWEFSWQDRAGRYALFMGDAAVQAQLRAQPPAPLAAALGQLRRRDRSRARWRGLGLSALALWLALPLLGLVLLLAAAGPLAGWLVGFVPLEHEEKLGSWFFEAQARSLKPVHGTAANQALEALGARLTQGSRYRYRWHIAQDPTLNAFAVPGGIVVVHTGLIRAADSAEELAGVLAHEVQHVEQRHSLKAFVQQAGLRVALAALVGDVGIAGEAAGRLGGLKFSRDHEHQADLEGLALLQRSGIATTGMLTMFQKLGAQDGGASAPAWLSTHPATPQRLARLRAAAAASDRAAAPLPVDWQSVRASLPD